MTLGIGEVDTQREMQCQKEGAEYRNQIHRPIFFPIASSLRLLLLSSLQGGESLSCLYFSLDLLFLPNLSTLGSFHLFLILIPGLND